MKNKILNVILIGYIIVLIWLLLVPNVFRGEQTWYSNVFSYQHFVDSNLIPFRTIIMYIYCLSAMSYYSPYALMLNIFLIDALTFAFMGMLLYTLSLFVSKIWSYVIVVVLIFLQSVFGKMGLVLDNFLPFSWISASHWRFGYDRHRPDLIYIYTAFCMLLFLLAVISEWKIKRMDWVSKEEHR